MAKDQSDGTQKDAGIDPAVAELTKQVAEMAKEIVKLRSAALQTADKTGVVIEMDTSKDKHEYNYMSSYDCHGTIVCYAADAVGEIRKRRVKIFFEYNQFVLNDTVARGLGSTVAEIAKGMLPWLHTHRELMMVGGPGFKETAKSEKFKKSCIKAAEDRRKKLVSGMRATGSSAK